MLLIDLSQISHASLAMERMQSPNMPIDKGLLKHFIINSLRANIVKFKGDYGKAIICADSSSWRYSYFSPYKANRKTAREEDKEFWIAVFETIQEVITILDEYSPIPVIKVAGAEADDIIGWITNKNGTNPQEDTSGLNGFGQVEDERILILSGDKDFQQLQVYDNVDQYSPTMKKFLKCKNPKEFLIEHIARGDVGDGVPNVLSVDNALIDKIRQTPITSKFLEEFKSKFDSIIDFDRELKISKDEFLRNFSRNKVLVDLVNEIPMDVQSSIEEQFIEKTTNPTGSLEQLRQAFIANRMKNLLDVIGDFKQPK